MDDLISRQAAIDLICDMKGSYDIDGYIMIYRSDAVDRISTMPSAQPEIIRCKDCKHKHIENSVWTCPFGLPGGPEFFCGYGAETRGEEHEDIPMEYYENGGI